MYLLAGLVVLGGGGGGILRLQGGGGQCTDCGRKFSRYNNAKRHFKLLHGGPSSFLCDRGAGERIVVAGIVTCGQSQ